MYQRYNICLMMYVVDTQEMGAIAYILVWAMWSNDLKGMGPIWVQFKEKLFSKGFQFFITKYLILLQEGLILLCDTIQLLCIPFIDCYSDLEFSKICLVATPDRAPLISMIGGHNKFGLFGHVMEILSSVQCWILPLYWESSVLVLMLCNWRAMEALKIVVYLANFSQW